MRNISQSALAQILQKEGTEPITLVQIFWDEQQSVIYGDRAFDPGIRGQLLNVGEINNVINASAGSNGGSVNIRLEDKDGVLKNIFNTMDIHKRPVYILQWFPEIPLSDSFVVFDGVISSPIQWSEGERTLSFDVLSKIEDLEVGYSAEEGNFEYIPPNLVGRAWPLVFGKVLKLPCIQINEIPSGTSLDDVGIDGTAQGPLNSIVNEESKNLTLLEELERQCFTNAAICLGNATALDSTTVNSAGSGLHGGGTIDATTGLSGAVSRKSDNPIAQQLYDLGSQYEAKGNEYRAERLRAFNTGINNTPEQNALNRNQVRIHGGSQFPQKTNIIIHINGAQHEGYFEGDIFTIVSSTSPFTDQNAVVSPTRVVDRAVATEYQTDVAVSSFFYSIAGSSVNVGTNYPVWYIAGMPYLTGITVVGEKQDGKKYTIPATYYSIVYKNFGTLQATFIVFTMPLSSRQSENWTDQVWVDCTSPLGPNAVDIIEYLVENYTNQSIDATSFAAVKIDVDPYKCNFALTTRRGTLQVIEEIAYQSRCAVWFKGGRFYLKYLPKQDDFVDTIIEDDVESGTMEVFSTETEDIVTKWSISWRSSLDKDPPNKIVYRYHIKKYGLIEEDYDCYIYNAKASVQKFAQFWLIRKANTWKKIKFSTFITKLRLEPFDSVLIDFAYPWVNDPGCVNPTVGIVEEASYDGETGRIQLTIWLPIRLGEMCPYDFAYPSELDTTLIFPQDSGGQTGVPGAGAEGPLYDQSPHTGPGGTPNSTPPNSGSSGDTTPGDATDSGNPIYNPPTALDPNELINTGAPTPVNTVSQRTIKPLTLQFLDVPDAAFPGFILGVEGDTISVANNSYIVDVYFDGLINPAKKVNVRQLLISDDDIIPVGTPVHVFRNCQRDNANKMVTNIEYTMQVPVWLKPDASQPPAPTELPEQDEGSEPEVPEELPPEDDEGDE